MIASGTKLGRYEILSLLGAGGMGEVYLAEDTKLDRKVALKILPAEFAEDKDRMSRFVREAKSASALNHPNIITIYEVGEFEGTHFIATEFVDGKTLNDYTKSNPPNFKSALEIAIQTASALDEAHQAGIVHRDIKPDNIMVRPNGLAKILDFGIAKLTETNPANVSSEEATAIKPQSTSPGMIIGTASYMSPEQAKGQTVDARSDIFSFGVVLYEMIAGHLPFMGKTPLESISSILKDEPKPLDNREIPPQIERIIIKSLRKDRNERYQTIKDLLIDLKDVKLDLDVQDKLEKRVSPDKEEPQTQILKATMTEESSQTTAAKNLNDSITIRKTNLNKAFLGGLAILLMTAIGLGYWVYSKNNAKQIESIAVMPFVNESGNADTEYLSDGMTELLIGSLSQLPNLSVKARTSVFRYKGKEIDPKRIGQELSVQAILTGRVVQRGNDLTLYVELIDAATENVLWKEDYNRSMNNLVSLQGDIAKDVSHKLKTKLSGADELQVTKTYTENTEAYRLYLKGLYHWNKRTGDDLTQALALFQQAIDKDPSYAKAYAGLALTYAVFGWNTVMTKEQSDEAGLKAKSAARKALELDDTLAEAYAVLANEKVDEWDFSGAENDFKRAVVELNPNFATARQWYSELLDRLGQNDEALAEIKRAYELDPFSPAVSMNVGLRYSTARRYDEAIAQYKKLIEAEPTYPMPYMFLGYTYAEKEMFEDAHDLSCKADVLLMIDTPENCEREKTAFREAIKKNGATGYWGKVLEIRLKEHKQGIEPAVGVARIYARLGEKERAFEWLEKAFAKRKPDLTYLKIDESFNNVKSDPRFSDLLRRIGLPQ